MKTEPVRKFSSVYVLTRKEAFRDDFPLEVFHFKQPFEIPHCHDFEEMVLVEKGSGLHITEEGEFPIFRGDIFLIKAGHPHTYENVKNLEIVNMLFLPELLMLPQFDLKNTSGYYAFFETRPLLRGRYRSQSRLTLTEEQLRRAQELILEIEQEEKRNDPGYRYFCVVAFMRLIGLVCRAFSEVERKPDNHLAQINRIIRFFEQNYPQPVRLEDLAVLCGKSTSSVVRLFREALGQSPIEYLIHLRLEKAAARLRSEEQTVSEIAAATGFPDSNYFSKMFSRKFELSPRAYRQQYRRQSGASSRIP